MTKQELVEILRLFSVCVLSTVADNDLNLEQKEHLIESGIKEVADTVMVCTKRCAIPSMN